MEGDILVTLDEVRHGAPHTIQLHEKNVAEDVGNELGLVNSMKICFLLFLLAAALNPLSVHGKEPSLTRETGLAAWYGGEFSRTASGERYDPSSMTAAHRTLPFGTLVQVRNLSNGCTVVVRINNRGPYGKGRIIDVSKAAAIKLKMISSGTAKVELVVQK